MPKGYWIAHVDVHDAATFEKYRAANAEPIAAFGGRFIVRGGQSEVRGGAFKPRHVVVEFPSFDAAKACYDSPGYKAACELRDAASSIDILIIEGYEA
jgi:uncharacterized protein (DUF1330 family)